MFHVFSFVCFLILKMIKSFSKTDNFIKMINLFSKTYDFIKMINLLSKTDDFIKNDKFI